MSFIIWFLIILGVVFLTIITIGIIIVVKIGDKKKIRVNIIDKTYSLQRFKTKKKNIIDGINFGEQKYIYDSECLVKGKYIDDIFFYENNPNPIKFNFDERVAKEYTAKDLKNIMDSNLIEKLFSEAKLDRIELLQIISLIGIVVVLIIVVLDAFVLKANIGSLKNQEFLVQAFKIAVKGG